MYFPAAGLRYYAVLCIPKGNDILSKPNFAEQINESICFMLCVFPRGAVGMHNTALTVHGRASTPPFKPA